MNHLAYKIQKINGKRERRNYGKTKNKVELNNLLEIQKDSYNWFINEGIKEVFDDIFPVESFTGNLSLEFGEYSFDEPRHTIKQCKERYSTYAAPLKVEARLFNVETGEVKEQEIYLGDMPLMTDSGAFIVNGAERVIVSQLVRSPSVYFGKEVDKKNGRVTVGCQVIPTRGTWLEYETDARDIIYVRIDRTRKVPVTTLLRAIGLSSDSDILDLFGEDEYLIKTIEKDTNKNTFNLGILALKIAGKKNGVSAIDKAIKVMNALNEKEHEWLLEYKHPLLPSPNLNVGVIRGGSAGSTVAGDCLFETCVHYLPRLMSHDQVVAEFMDVIDRVTKSDKWLEVHPPKVTIYQAGGGFEMEEDSAFVDSFKEAYKAARDKDVKVVGSPAGCDSRLWRNIAGCPTVQFGPGNLSECHATDEWISIESYLQSILIYAELILSFCKNAD